MKKTQPPGPGPTRDGGVTLTPARRRSLRRRLLDWYDAEGRDLPWRTKGAPGDPYRVWISEIMLQQTAVVTVIPYFQDFVRRWPELPALAAAGLDDVLVAWQGLGYYARARNLHACAQVLCAVHGGRFPADEAGLRSLPGIGPYTAAAIAAIAFDRPATAVDGNVERVMARLFAVEAPLPESKALLTRAAAGLTPKRRPGDYAQALMDLGATVCTPRVPDCGACPWRRGCRARASGIAAELPRRIKKKPRPTRYALAYWVERPDGAVLLRRRAESGLLGGMMEVPSTPWRARAWPIPEAARHAPCTARWRAVSGTVGHTFTHFHLEMAVVKGRTDGVEAVDGVWVRPADFGNHALPTLMKKIARHAHSKSALAHDGAGAPRPREAVAVSS